MSIMSDVLATPIKRRPNLKRNISATVTLKDDSDNNNVQSKISEHVSARNFALWYKRMMDRDRYNVGPYLAEDAMLQWFGRTVRTRKKVMGFLKHDMQCSSHDFTTIESKDKILSREEMNMSATSKEESKLASPLQCPGSPNMTPELCRKRSGLRSSSKSSTSDSSSTDSPKATSKKKLKLHQERPETKEHHDRKDKCDINIKSLLNTDGLEMNRGDGLPSKLRKKSTPVTPPNRELGQGDCLPSTSGTDSMSDVAHSRLYAQLPRKAVECNGYVVFSRTRNSRTADAMKWERKCKVQILYSEDPLHDGEYIIWAIYYSDESKCRRNLLAAFEEVSKSEEKI